MNKRDSLFLDGIVQKVKARQKKSPVWQDISARGLAGELGISRKRARKFINMTKGNGDARFLANVDKGRLGFSKVLLYVYVRRWSDVDYVARRFTKVRYVRSIIIAYGGRPCIIIEGDVPQFRLTEFIDSISNVYKRQMYSPSVEMVSKRLVEYGVMREETPEIIHIDEADFKMLKSLKANAELTLKELGKIAGLREPTVFARLARLKKAKVIMGYYFKTKDSSKRYTRVVFSIKAEPELMRPIISMISSGGIQLRSAYELLSEHNLYVEMAAEDEGRIHGIMKSISRKYRNVRFRMMLVADQLWGEVPSVIEDFYSKKMLKKP